MTSKKLFPSSFYIEIGLFFFLILGFIGCNKEKLVLDQSLLEIDSLNQQNKDTSTFKSVFLNCQYGDTILNVKHIEGYSDKMSYYPSETIKLFVHSKTKEFSLELYRFGKSMELIDSKFSENGFEQHLPCHTYKDGCAWKNNETLELPSNLKSGLYSLKLVSPNMEESWITFIVKTSPSSDILVLASTNTWQAYNNRGRASFYYNQVNPSAGNAVEILSFMRPNPAAIPIIDDPNKTVVHLADAEAYLTKWLETEGYNYDMISDEDLHNNSLLLTNYKTLIIHTHPEYWTENMRFSLEYFLSKGGNLMYLGANAIWWKVVFDHATRSMEVIKGRSSHSFDFSQGGAWVWHNKPPSQLLGLTFTITGHGTYAPYKVHNSNHWIFNGTNLKNNDLFAENCDYCGGGSGQETDKPDASSPKLDTLAIGTNPDNGGAYMVYSKDSVSGSQIFSVGSITFTRTLALDQNSATITKNVLTEFLK